MVAVVMALVLLLSIEEVSWLLDPHFHCEEGFQTAGEKGNHSCARFDLCTMYGHIHQHIVHLF